MIYKYIQIISDMEIPTYVPMSRKDRNVVSVSGTAMDCDIVGRKILP